MTENNAAQPGLTDDEIRDIITNTHQAYGAFKTGYGLALGRAIESALLSKLRAEGVQAGDEREIELHRQYAENATFRVWWDENQACPEHSLTTENAAHAAWQERGRRAALASAPVADGPCKRCGGPGWYTNHTTGHPESFPCVACNPQGVSVERLAKDPFLAAQLWRKPAEADGSLLERILEHVGEYGESMASSTLLSVRTIARRNVETRIAAELASAPVAAQEFKAAFPNGTLPATRFHELWERAGKTRRPDYSMLENLRWQVGQFADLVAREVSAPVAGWGCAHKNKVANAASYVWHCRDCGKFIPREPGDLAASAPVAGIPVKTHAMHTAVRHVLRTHKLTKGPDGVIEADLIYAVLSGLSAPVAGEAQPSDADIESFAKAHGLRWEDGSYWAIEDADLHPMIRALIDRYAGRPDVNAAMAAEYQRWIDYYHQGRDYDSFLKECVYGHKPAPVDTRPGHNAAPQASEAVEFHMADAYDIQRLLATDQIDRRVDHSELGVMGAEEVETWNTKIGHKIEIRHSNGGVTATLYTSPVADKMEADFQKGNWPPSTGVYRLERTAILTSGANDENSI